MNIKSGGSKFVVSAAILTFLGSVEALLPSLATAQQTCEEVGREMGLSCVDEMKNGNPIGWSSCEECAHTSCEEWGLPSGWPCINQCISGSWWNTGCSS